mmetsp:Transcript_17957/g.39822  ORF Transcript_17957/g.39822 Transcript_17957/m.39822 type:complete len:284 (-) Transcript_17957:1911-2762(-)
MSRRKLLAGALALTSVLFTRFTAMFLEPLFGQGEQSLREIDAARRRKGIVDVYVPGAGFSGFFYMLGRLQSVNWTPHNRFHCFSAGCLALTATLLEAPIEEVVELALSSRSRVVHGEISRFDVLEDFVESLLDDGSQPLAMSMSNQNRTDQLSASKLRNLERHLPYINILTSTYDMQHVASTGGLVGRHFRSVSTIAELKTALVQTTWIPTITGKSFASLDMMSGAYHNDGAFSGLLRGFGVDFDLSLLLPWDLALLSNSLNLFMTTDQALEFWRVGVQRGIT